MPTPAEIRKTKTAAVRLRVQTRLALRKERQHDHKRAFRSALEAQKNPTKGS